MWFVFRTDAVFLVSMYIRWVEHITHFQRYVVLVMSSSFLSWFLWFFLRDFLRFACNEFGLWCRGVFGSLGTQMVGRAKLFEKLVTTLSRQETYIIRWVETQRFCKKYAYWKLGWKWWFPIWRISGTFLIFGCLDASGLSNILWMFPAMEGTGTP